MEPRIKASQFSWAMIFFLTISLCEVEASSEEEHHAKGPVVENDQRRTLLTTEYGEISAIDVKDGHKGLPYHLQFFTLELNSLFLPVLLHADMVFYVHTGSGRLTWAHEEGTSTIDLRQGDLCSLNEGSVFYIQSNLEAERRKLRIYAMFTNREDNTFDPSIGAYSRINELVRGFDKKIMQAALKVPDDLIEAITSKTNTPAIVHAVSEKNKVWELEASFLKNFLGVRSNSKKLETYNIFDNDPDFKNDNGWSIAVTKKQLKSLKSKNIGFFMVHLTKGSIMGPHWNPRATEIAVAVDGEGMVRVVCGSTNDYKTECKNMRFNVKEGDVFVVPRFHPMAQMSYNDEPFVFLGFSTNAKENHPRFLAGKGSVLAILDKRIVATSLGVSEKTMDELLRSPDDSVIFGCGSCAEEEEKIMKEEEEKEKRKEEEEEEARRQEEERKREEEEAKREQEEREKRREEEEEKEQEEAERERERERKEEAKREEEEEKEQEEAKRERERERKEEAKREEEEARRQQEEREKKREEEEGEREGEREREKEEVEREEEEDRREEAKREEEEARREEEKRERRGEEEAEGEKEQARREAEREQEEEQAKRQQEKRERKREEEDEEEGAEGESDNKFMERGVQSKWSGFDGRRVLKNKEHLMLS